MFKDANWITYVQLRFPLETAASVCPPRIQFKIMNPVIVRRLRTLGTIAP